MFDTYIQHNINNIQNELSKDFLNSFIKEGTRILKQDFEEYDFEAYTKSVKKTGLKDEQFLILKNALEKYIIHQDIIEVDNIDPFNVKNLKQVILTNSMDDNTHYYVVKGKYQDGKRIYEHYFLTIQNQTKIDVIDSMGSERKDFFETFVVDSDLQNALVKQSKFTYTQNTNRLQYSSGVYEVYAVKLAFYLARAHIFNSLSKRFNITKNTIAKDKKTIEFLIDPVFQNGLDETAFGMQTSTVYFGDRLKILQEQINLLNKEKQSSPLYYFVKKEKQVTFQDIFIKDLEESKKLLIELHDKYKARKEDFLKILTNKKEIVSLNKDDVVKKIYDMVFDERQEFIPTEDKYYELFIEEERQGFSYEQFEQTVGVMNEILYKRYYKENDCDNAKMLKELKEDLFKLGKIDFLNPYMVVKSGHMYFESLRFQKVLEDMKKN